MNPQAATSSSWQRNRHRAREQIDVETEEAIVVELRHVGDLLRRSTWRGLIGVHRHMPLILAARGIDIEVSAFRLRGIGGIHEIRNRQRIEQVGVLGECARIGDGVSLRHCSLLARIVDDFVVHGLSEWHRIGHVEWNVALGNRRLENS
jgi:hypothetical protein